MQSLPPSLADGMSVPRPAPPGDRSAVGHAGFGPIHGTLHEHPPRGRAQ
jgi:hypothetical protein